MELGIDISKQLISFAWSVGFGAMLGVFFGVFQFLRRTGRSGKLLTAFEDLFFWIISAFVFYAYFLIFTEGRVRFYAFFGAAIGFTVYKCTVGRFLLFLACKAFEGGKKVLFYFGKKIFMPIQRIFCKKSKNNFEKPLESQRRNVV